MPPDQPHALHQTHPLVSPGFPFPAGGYPARFQVLTLCLAGHTGGSHLQGLGGAGRRGRSLLLSPLLRHSRHGPVLLPGPFTQARHLPARYNGCSGWWGRTACRRLGSWCSSTVQTRASATSRLPLRPWLATPSTRRCVQQAERVNAQGVQYGCCALLSSARILATAMHDHVFLPGAAVVLMPVGLGFRRWRARYRCS